MGSNPRKNAGAGGKQPAATAAGQAEVSTVLDALQLSAGSDQSTAGRDPSSTPGSSSPDTNGSCVQGAVVVATNTSQAGAAGAAAEPQPGATGANSGAQLAEASDETSGIAEVTEPVNTAERVLPVGYGLQVSCLVDGYRRAGRAWSREPQIVKLAELTEEQVEILRGDREIRIEPVWLGDGEAE